MGDLRTFIDQMGEEVTFNFPPKRVLSLVPSQTEYLFDIGINVIGRTKFCIHPKEKVKKIPVIGGTKNFHFDRIRELDPDLIIGNKEENYKEGITQLRSSYPVWMSDIETMNDAYSMMGLLGKVCDREDEAAKVIVACRTALAGMYRTARGRVLYLIWQKPWMAAGHNTFIDHMLEFLGYENVLKDARYPELTDEAITELDPELILLSSEPFPFKEKHIKSVQALCPDAKCKLVDGELYSWYGSRLQYWSSVKLSNLKQHPE